MTDPNRTNTDPKPAEHSTHAMQCMEVWGGNIAIESGVSLPGIDAWVFSQPYQADVAGGDIYYVSMCGEGRIGRFIVADVSGHGAAMDSLSRELRTLMRKSIARPDQTRIARGLNESFGQLSADGMFATAVLMTYFAPTDQLVCCLAGHPKPLWYRANVKRWELLGQSVADTQAFQGLPLGVIHPTAYSQFAVTLDRGDLVVAYTDALIEARGPDGGMLGEEGLLDLASTLEPCDPERFGRNLIAAIDRPSGDTSKTRKDDLTLLVLHHNAIDPKPVSLGHKLRMMAKMLGL